MSEIINEIEKLAELRDKGILTDEEFQQKKTRLLSEDRSTGGADDHGREESPKSEEVTAWPKKAFWGYILLSALIPIVGVIVGIVAMTKGGKKVRQGIILIIVSVGVASLYLAAIDGGESSQSAVVQIVQDGTLDAYPAQTLGEAVDSFFRNPRWEHIRGEDGNDYVNITGKASFMGSTVDMLLQYRVYRDAESFELQAFEMNDVPQNMIMYNGLLSAMYE
jgi:hypothetical protein